MFSGIKSSGGSEKMLNMTRHSMKVSDLLDECKELFDDKAMKQRFLLTRMLLQSSGTSDQFPMLSRVKLTMNLIE